MTHRFLFITHQLTRTGAPLVLLDVIKNLHSLGNHIDVISMSEGVLSDDLEQMGISVRIQERFLPVWEHFIEEVNNYECVICNTLVTFEAIHILNHTSVPTIWWIHEPREYFDMYSEVLPDFKSLNENIHLIAVSPVNKDIIKDLYGMDVPILTIGVDDVYDSGKSKNSDENVRFICVGLYSFTKGQDVLASAIASLPTGVLKQCEFIFCGDEKGSDQDYVSTVRKLSNVFSNVRMIDTLPHDKLLSEMKKTDFLVAPSRLDSLPTVAVEAMMLGIPVILSDVCGVGKYLNGEGGYVFSSENVAELTSILEKAVKTKRDNNLYLTIADEARSHYVQSFSRDAFNDRLMSLVKRITPTRRIIFIMDTRDVLDIFSVVLIKQFRKMGYEVLEFRLSDLEGSLKKMADMISEGRVCAVFNYNFYSAFMEYKPGENFWEHFNIPIVTMLMDHPFCFDEAFEMLPAHSVVLCPDKNHMNYILRFYKNVETVGYLPHGGQMALTEFRPISERSIDVLYMGGISAPNAYKIMPDFSKYDFDARSIGNEAYEVLIDNTDMTTEEALEKCLINHGIAMEDDDLRHFIADMHYVDLLAVSYYREKTIRVLADAGIKVRLYGFGWDSIEWIKSSCVEYSGRISAFDVPELMNDAKIVLSTMTWFKDGTHDRVFNGMLHGAVSVTDTSKYMEEEFKGIYAGGDYEINGAELGFFKLSEIERLPEMISYLLSHTDLAQRIADAGYERAKSDHTWESRAIELDRDLLQYM